MGLLCYILGHDWRHNFVSMPNKRICTKCKTKHALDLSTLKWLEPANGERFSLNRSDETLIATWHK